MVFVCTALSHRGKFWRNILGTPGDCNTFWAQGTARYTRHTVLHLFVQRPLSLHMSYAWQLNDIYTSTHSLYKHGGIDYML